MYNIFLKLILEQYIGGSHFTWNLHSSGPGIILNSEAKINSDEGWPISPFICQKGVIQYQQTHFVVHFVHKLKNYAHLNTFLIWEHCIISYMEILLCSSTNKGKYNYTSYSKSHNFHLVWIFMKVHSHYLRTVLVLNLYFFYIH